MTANSKEQERILVIKLGALGDFIQALGPMAAIRNHHKEAHITLLTTKPFKRFAEKCNYFNEIWIDTKPKFYQISGWRALRKKLNSGQFDRVYDLQNNDRTSFYLKLFSPKPEWVGAAPGASHRNTSPERTAGHAFDGHVQTLALVGVKNVQIDTLEWMKGDISGFALKAPYALLVPGSAPQHLYKRWPAQSYAALAKALHERGVQPVILGALSEIKAAQTIMRACPEALNLVAKTSLDQIISLAKDADFAVGNDTGPMHLIGASGCTSLVLFSGRSNPVRHKPKGRAVKTLQSQDLSDLSLEAVLGAL
ncbi:MAG: glycosyltransferase family 9 protein [Alphaproteobacteria bacterium]|nr:glycosyltransferase family 9 protein [Alphaproteobacteria bacterium]